MTDGQDFFKEAIRQIPPSLQKQVDWSMAISDSIASILSERHLTQKEFARQMGKSEAEVSRWLAGLHNFTLSTIAKISAVLGTDLIRVANV